MTRNIACATDSITSKIALPFAPMAATATPKKVANTTTCRMSPRAIASMTEVGNRCRSMSHTCCCTCGIAATAVVSAPSGTESPTPGWKTFTSTSPMIRATVVATSK